MPCTLDHARNASLWKEVIKRSCLGEAEVIWDLLPAFCLQHVKHDQRTCKNFQGLDDQLLF